MRAAGGADVRAHGHSLFSRHRASSVERELARTPYAFTPNPRVQHDDHDIKLAKERLLDPFEDDINVRLAKERLFGGYSRTGSRATSPSAFPSSEDFGRRLSNDDLENILFGPDVGLDTLSNISERFSDTSSVRTSRNDLSSVHKQDVFNANVAPKKTVFRDKQIVPPNTGSVEIINHPLDTNKNIRKSSNASSSNSVSSSLNRGAAFSVKHKQRKDSTAKSGSETVDSSSQDKKGSRKVSTSSEGSTSVKKGLAKKREEFVSKNSESLDTIDSYTDVIKPSIDSNANNVTKGPAFGTKPPVVRKREAFVSEKSASLETSESGSDTLNGTIKSGDLGEEKIIKGPAYGTTDVSAARDESFDDTRKVSKSSLNAKHLDNIEVKIIKGPAYKTKEIPRSKEDKFPPIEDKRRVVINSKPEEIGAGTIIKGPAYGTSESLRTRETTLADVDLRNRLNSLALARYEKSRELAKSYTDNFYRSISHEFVGSDDSAASRSGGDGSPQESSLVKKKKPPDADTSVDLESFKVLGKPGPPADLESVSSTPSSYKLPTTVRPHRVTAFAILGEELPPAAALAAAPPPAPAPTLATAPSPAPPAPISGRVSPFRGKGFKPDPLSRHTTPRTSRASSPQRSRANSLSRDPPPAPRPSVSFERSPTPARNYIQENICEVKELSEFNKERNQEIAEQKRLEEEIEILKELGIVDEKTAAKLLNKKVNLRSRSSSPSAVLQLDNYGVPNRTVSMGVVEREMEMPVRDYVGRPPAGKNAQAWRGVSKSQPQSNIGSPQHQSKIPRRQTSVSPPRQRAREILQQSKMVNTISPDGRFISNSTSSINDNRVFSIITDEDNNPVDINMGTRSKSSLNLTAGPSILKTKPPRSPGKLGPPPTHRAINNKRLSPINATPDKSPVQGDSGKGTRRGDSRSKTSASNVTSPSRIPKRPSKSLATSPNASRTASRAASRGPSRDVSPLKKTASNTRLNNGSTKTPVRSNSRLGHKKSDSIDSNETEKKFPLKRANSRTSVMSKASMGSSHKPDLKRTNSRTSMKPLTRNNSIKSINEKPGLKRKSSLKSMQEKSTEEKPGKPGAKDKNKKSTNKQEQQTDEVATQDNETQFDKISHLNMSVDKLIPLTKGNVVSMTTAAITSQPLEIAAKVTSQLPAAFEKAREKRAFERNSSSDSIAAKMLETANAEAGEGDESDEKSKLEKMASRSSLGLVKEEKEPANGDSSTIIHNNMKLKPIITSLDPQVEKVKMKIDNILKSTESSMADLRERVQNDEKSAAEKANHSLDKVAEKSEEKAKKDEPAKKAEEKAKEGSMKSADKTDAPLIVPKPIDHVKDNGTKKVLDEVKSVLKETENGGNVSVNAVLNGKKNGVGKTMPPVENVASKTEAAKAPAKDHHAELITVKETDIKKEALTPVVTVVNEKASAEEQEHMTESIVRGDPDVEVQSANIPPAKPDAHSMNSGRANGASTSNGSKAPEAKKGEASKPAGKGASPAVPDIPAKKGACANCYSRLLCCRKSTNSSELQLIDESVGKKRESTQGAGKPGEKKTGLRRLVCCGKGNEDASLEAQRKASDPEAKSCSSCMACCRGKNKVQDSSSTLPNDGGPKTSWWRCLCCAPKDTAARRDSILSQPNNTSWWRRMACCCKSKADAAANRRPSMFSKKRSLSQAVPLEDKRQKLDASLVEHNSHLRGAIPALPLPLAWICLLFNILVPGLGTVCSGLFCLCFGRPRFSMFDGYRQRMGAFVINLVVGIGQLFTVLFCLVGWGWSIWWATIMVRVARKYKKLKKTAMDAERGVVPANNHRSNHT